ncbi:MAG: DUF192 domain-containing protein [Candidatus Cloacimonetes bacterium]|nr:DUF192 domain-containing protein [Candidatus Cloacimonadota bacterium]
MNRVLFFLSLLLIFSQMLGCSKSPQPEPSTEKPKYQFRHDGVLDIIAKDGSIKTNYQIEIVVEQEEVMRGLKNRESMAENQAMLFVFPKVEYYDFWMQDTYLPLDMLFISADETVFQIIENAKPFSEDRIKAEQPNSYVLEIIAGSAKKYNIQVGDKIKWKRNP